MEMISQTQKAGLRNPWLLGLLGLIVLVLAVNGTFIWLATHNKSTLVDREYKTKDRKSKTEYLSELGAQQALAWKTTIKKPKAIVLNVPTFYEISVADRDGKPVSGEMKVEAYRGADANKDFMNDFMEVASGTYHGYITFPLKGYWELHIHVKRGTDDFTVDSDRFTVADVL